MRAAHSIKGAARIVGLDSAVTLAHSMEDLLSAAQKGTLRLSSAHIDLLLKGNDLFSRLPGLAADELHAYLREQEPALRKLVQALSEAPATESPAVVSAQTAAALEPAPGAQPTPPAQPPKMSVDASLFELFRVEVEGHSRILESGLVEVEADQRPEKVEPLMRAAHSIKGAARIVGLDSAVTLAHSMEDLLSAAQKGRLRLSSSHIDLLLKGNDLLSRLADLAADELHAYLREQEPALRRLVQALSEAPTTKSPAVVSAQTAAVSEPAPAPPAPPEPKRKETPTEKADGGLVRVMAANLSRMMGLAGECLVQARSMKPFSVSLLDLKSMLPPLGASLEDALACLEEGETSEVQEKLQQLVQRFEQIPNLLVKHMEAFEAFSRRVEQLTERMYAEVVASRMQPFSDGLHGFPRMARDLAKRLGKSVRLQVVGEATPVDRDILEKLEAPLGHLLRNSIDHGVETPEQRRTAGKPPEGNVLLEAHHVSGMLHIVVRDDGKGIDQARLRRKIVDKGMVSEEMAAGLSEAEALEFLFLPGFSTASEVTDISGRGVGLDVVQSMVRQVSGSVRVESRLGHGTKFTLELPLTLSVLRALIVEIGGEPYAIPLSRINRIVQVSRQELKVLEDRHCCLIDGEPVGVVDAHQVLQVTAGDAPETLSIVVVSDRMSRYGIMVERFVGERDLVVLPLDPRLGRVANISAGALLEDGAPALIVDVDDLVRSIDQLLTQGRLRKVGTGGHKVEVSRKRVLIVDDSLTVREVERRLLENRGYEVTTAVDGVEGWHTLRSYPFDLLISDIDMPRMNGVDLVRRVKSDPSLRRLPVIIVSYKDREEDRLLGLEAGANYYLTKSSFHDESLVGAVRDLIGTP
jgi:two-component system sensor histidine kinase and response regulator WspE